MKTFIKDIAYYLPKEILTNEQIAEQFPEWSAEKVANKVGITERHISAPDETATDMAYQAAERLFAQGVDRNIIDFVLLCTQSGDYFLPSSACLLQDRLGLSKNCGALDFNLGCSGYEYGLALSKGLIVAGIAKNILLLTAETYTKYIHPKDKGNRTIFGDGASASLISTEGFAEIGEVVLGTDGSGAENLIVRSLSARHKDRGKGQAPYRALGIAHRAHGRGQRVILEGERKAQQHQPKIARSAVQHLLRRAQQPQERHGQRDRQQQDANGQHQAKQANGGYLPAQVLLILRAEEPAHQHRRADGQAADPQHRNGHHRIGSADRRHRRLPGIASDHHRVHRVVHQLEQVAQDQRQRVSRQVSGNRALGHLSHAFFVLKVN